MSLSRAREWSSQTFARVERRTRALGARTRDRLGLPSPGAGSVRVAPGFRHPIEAARRAELTALYRARFPRAVDAEVAEAGRLAAHRITVLGHAMEHGPRIAWSRDPISGRDWPRRFAPDIAYRGPERRGDIKLPWELNKHQYFFTLGKAAWLTGQSALAVEIVRQIDDWIEDNPCERGIHWISALETGTRAISWILAYPFYAEHGDAAFHARLLASLGQHLRYVEQHLSTGRFANTHLLGEAAVLVVGALFLDCRHSARWLARGLAIMDEESVRQVTADGLHAERSIAYHRFFLDHYLLVGALLAANGRSPTPATRARVEQMTDALRHVLHPDGSVPAFGDGDDARGIWTHAEALWDYRGLLALGAVLFGRADFKAAARGLTEEVLWLLGPEGVAAFDALGAPDSGETPAASVAYPDAGYYVMRVGGGDRDPVLTFDCGPLGFGPAGHGHADALSLQLHAAGYPFLVDAGTFSYNIDYAWRDAFRGTRAHNTIVVDGRDQSEPADRLSWKTMARARARRWLSTRWFDLADGEHDGYTRLADPVMHRRVVIFLKPDAWIIWDDLQGRTRHTLESLLHARPDCRVDVAGTTARFTAPDGQRLHAQWSCEDGPIDVAEAIPPGGARESGAWFSSAYGVREPAPVLRVARTFEGRCRLVTCLTIADDVRPVVSSARGALEVRVSRADGGDARLCYPVDPAWVPLDEATPFEGAALFQRRAPGEDEVRLVVRDGGDGRGGRSVEML